MNNSQRAPYGGDIDSNHVGGHQVLNQWCHQCRQQHESVKHITGSRLGQSLPVTPHFYVILPQLPRISQITQCCATKAFLTLHKENNNMSL